MNAKLLKTKELQNNAFETLSELLSGLSSPVRLKLLHFLSQSPLTVEVLATKIDQSVANTSMHLRKMYAAGLVDVSVKGQKRVYQLHPPVLLFWEKAQDLLQALYPQLDLGIKETYGDYDAKDTAQFIDAIKKKKALILDVRPEDEQTTSPFKHLEFYKQVSANKLSSLPLPKDKVLYVFCRGRFCALSADSVFQLRKRGYETFRLSVSWLELQNILKGAKLW